MFTRLELSQFKSIQNLKIDLGKINGFVGMNGSGKSTILQAFDFISQMIIGNFDAWIESREWDRLSDIQNKHTHKSHLIEGILEFKLPKDSNSEDNEDECYENITWNFIFDLNTFKCEYECIRAIDSKQEIKDLLEVKNGVLRTFDLSIIHENNQKKINELFRSTSIDSADAIKIFEKASTIFHQKIDEHLKAIEENDASFNSKSLISFEIDLDNNYENFDEIVKPFLRDSLYTYAKIYTDILTDNYYKEVNIEFDYQGSILSTFDISKLPPEIVLLHNSLLNISTLEQLSPSLLRKKSRAYNKGIGIGGERLSGFLSSKFLNNSKLKNKFLSLLQQLNPNIVNISLNGEKGGWQSLDIEEKFESSRKVSISSKHTNDGLLRCIAMIAQSHFHDSSLILLDEIENGLNQEIINKIGEILIGSNVQVIFTTHSPLMLNAFPEDYINNNVHFCYRAKNGVTKLEKLIDIVPEPEMLNFLGIGEVYLQTNLIELQEKCNSSVKD
jgi:AAA15 family ATPase/GTPase